MPKVVVYVAAVDWARKLFEFGEKQKLYRTNCYDNADSADVLPFQFQIITLTVSSRI